MTEASPLQSTTNLVRAVPRSIEPQQVNDFQRPVFTLRLENTGDESVEISAESELWVVDYAYNQDRGFRARLESYTLIAPRSQAVLRFLPTVVSVPLINSGSFPVRLMLHVSSGGTSGIQNLLTTDNRVRVGGNNSKSPINSIGLGVGPSPLLVLSREGGYREFPLILDDMFPVDVKINWQDPDPDWHVQTDDGADLTTVGEATVRQMRAWTEFGIRVVPPSGFPSNQVAQIGTFVAQRCPLSSDGLGACPGVGARIRAVIAESVEVSLHDLSVSDMPTRSIPGSDIYIQGTVTNPFYYPVSIEGPAGVVAFADGLDSSQYFRYRSLTFCKLEPRQSEQVSWKITIRDDTPRGLYTLQPYLAAAVGFSRETGDSLLMKAEINHADPAVNLAVQVLVV